MDCDGTPLVFVFLSSIEWAFNWQRPQQIASRLAKHGHVVYFDPLGLRSPRLTDLPRLMSRIRSARTAGNSPAVEGSNSVQVVSVLPFVPLPSSRLASWVNANILFLWLRRKFSESDCCIVLWVGIPNAAFPGLVTKVRSSWKNHVVVYDCIDEHALFHRDSDLIRTTEEHLAKQADVVFGTAAPIAERMRMLNPNTHLLPNAADFAHFNQARHTMAVPPDMTRISHPIIGYFGGIASWFDQELVRRLAQAHPAWSFVLIGQSEVDVGLMVEAPNIYLLGPKPYRELPSYLADFDVCIIPFVVNALTNSVDPVKLYEYASAGKPIVSTPFTSVLRFGSVVRIASGPKDFGNAISDSLSPNERIVEELVSLAREQTWESRVSQAMLLLRESLERHASARV
jgi:glycosyltransferase involved in cell wall biosynthesis